MSTGLTVGTIAASYGLSNGHIDQATYTILVTVVILSAVVPTLLTTKYGADVTLTHTRKPRTQRQSRRDRDDRQSCSVS